MMQIHKRELRGILQLAKGFKLNFQQDSEWLFIFFKTAGFNHSPTPPFLRVSGEVAPRSFSTTVAGCLGFAARHFIAGTGRSSAAPFHEFVKGLEIRARLAISKKFCCL
jgi:hypothetical protein